MSTKNAADNAVMLTGRKGIRLYHRRPDGTECHAFDVEAGHYASIRDDHAMASARAFRYPDGTTPVAGSQVCCGTCKGFPGSLRSMRAEPITL